MEDRKNLYKKLKDLIYKDKHNEVECREYLKYVVSLLVKETFNEDVTYEQECPQYCGRSDLLIRVKVKDEFDDEKTLAYIWEVKAAQCYIFKTETKSRLCPSQYLYKAENQLLHYYNGFYNDRNAQIRLGILHPEQIKFGGIIIGRKDKLVENKHEVSDVKGLYNITRPLREKYFYNDRIKLITWDDILNYLKGKKHTSEEQQISQRIDFKKELSDKEEISESFDFELSRLRNKIKRL